MPEETKRGDGLDIASQLPAKPGGSARPTDAIVFAEEMRTSQVEVESYLEALLGAQERLAECLRNYRDLINATPFPCLTLDEQYAILEANPAAAEFLGANREDLVQRTVFGYVENESHGAFRDCLLRALDSPRCRVESFLFRSDKGAVRVVATISARERLGDRITITVMLKEPAPEN